MQPKASQRPDCNEALQEDELTQEGILCLVLTEHPIVLTVDEIASEVGGGGAARRGVDDLVRIGLLRREGDSVLPTRPALHFDRIVGWTIR